MQTDGNRVSLLFSSPMRERERGLLRKEECYSMIVDV